MLFDQKYDEYRAKVADECVKLMHGRCTNHDGSKMTDGEIRYFFGVQCSYHEEFKEFIDPKEVAEQQWEAIT